MSMTLHEAVAEMHRRMGGGECREQGFMAKVLGQARDILKTGLRPHSALTAAAYILGVYDTDSGACLKGCYAYWQQHCKPKPEPEPEWRECMKADVHTYGIDGVTLRIEADRDGGVMHFSASGPTRLCAFRVRRPDEPGRRLIIEQRTEGGCNE